MRQLGMLLLAVCSLAQAALADPHTLVDQGQQAYRNGNFNQAAADWQKALDAFHQQKDSRDEILVSLSLAAAYQALGQQRRAAQLLQDTLSLAEKTNDRAHLALIKAKLGAAFILTRETDTAASLLKEALPLARNNHDLNLAAAILNDQGTLLIILERFQEALAAFSESVALARETGNRPAVAEALCNAAAAAARSGDSEKAEALNGQALNEIDKMSLSHTRIFLLLRAGQTDHQIPSTLPAATSRLRLRAQHSFEKALQQSDQLKDRAGQTYALGYLGELYEQDGQFDVALNFTRRASFAAQEAQMPEALYRWQWHIGRLLNARGETEQATAAYRRAIQTLQPIRNDISLGYGNALARTAFREGNGPLYFELADVLLRQARSATNSLQTRELLLEARDTVEQLKAVELEDYFRDDCVNVQRARQRTLEAVDEHTAVVYLIPLPTRTELLVGLTSGLTRFTLDVSADSLTSEVRQFRRNLETRTTYAYLAQAQQLYDWLIRPIRPLLEENHVDTLVFVPDGALRTIPLASLHDGDRFLVQDFAIAVTPGLSLVEPHPLRSEKVHLLMNGLSKAVQGFPALRYVPGELQSIEALYRSDTLLDEGFTLSELQRKLADNQYSIIHIASHGQFDRDVRNTFLLTYDGKLTLNHLEALIRPSQYRGQPVELLVLSACQTAAGDDQAALGLAGVAVKAGARSALATLWFVNDQSTSVLVSELYSQLRNSASISKARALQAAQIKLLSDRRYRHPCYWAPYLIIGNWL